MTPPVARHSFSPDSVGSEKAATRERTLSLVREHSQFWHPTGHYLTCDWIELCGYDDETLKMLLQTGALKSGSSAYLGVNSSPEVIEHNKTAFPSGTPAEWIHGQWGDEMAYGNHPRAGVIVFDSFNSVSNAHLETLLKPTFAFAKKQQETLGQALLVLNLALRGKDSRNKTQKAQAQVRYRNIIQKEFGVEVSERDFTTYTSKVIPMLICWISLGF